MFHNSLRWVCAYSLFLQPSVHGAQTTPSRLALVQMHLLYILAFSSQSPGAVIKLTPGWSFSPGWINLFNWSLRIPGLITSGILKSKTRLSHDLFYKYIVMWVDTCCFFPRLSFLLCLVRELLFRLQNPSSRMIFLVSHPNSLHQRISLPDLCSLSL